MVVVVVVVVDRDCVRPRSEHVVVISLCISAMVSLDYLEIFLNIVVGGEEIVAVVDCSRWCGSRHYWSYVVPTTSSTMWR